MKDITKQSEETYIRWSVNINSAIEVGQLQPEPILTIHPDGRVTTNPRLKPTEAAALVLDQIKTHWMRDGQATKIRELQDQIERLEYWKQSALAVEREWNANAIATMLGGKLGESQREVIQREVPKLLERIKRLEELGKELRECASQLGWTSSDDSRWIERAEAVVEAWDKAKEDKL